MSKYTANTVVKFPHRPRHVDSRNADAATDSKKFIDCPRGRRVNTEFNRVDTEFSVPDVPQKELIRMFPHEWNCFRAMKYERCGKNGRYICHPDIDTFPKYLAAFGPVPDPSFTLDRKDPNDLTYAPSKCEWAPLQRQAGIMERQALTIGLQKETRRRTMIPARRCVRVAVDDPLAR